MEKVLKNQKYDGSDVQHWSSCTSPCPSKVCSWFWLSHVVLWEGAGQIPCGRSRETVIISFLWKGSSYISHRASGNCAVLLTPTSLDTPVIDLALGFTEEHTEDSCHVLVISSLFQTVRGPSFVSQWDCGHFLLSQTAFWEKNPQTASSPFFLKKSIIKSSQSLPSCLGIETALAWNHYC